MARDLTIGGVQITEDAPCYVIAEIGNNHGGDVEVACEMVRACALAGVSAVKVQARTMSDIYTRPLLDQPYDHEHSYGPTYGAHRDALELSEAALTRVGAAAADSRVTYIGTAFDEASLDRLLRANVQAIKIASGDLTNTPLIAEAARAGLPVILSTGGGLMADIDRAVETALRHTSDLAVLQCTAAYPIRTYQEVNLRVIPALRVRYPEVVIGWSSHVNGIALAPVAYTLGARILEQHVTLNRAGKGTDHAFSLEPAGLRKLVRDLARTQLALGDGVKVRYPSEDAPLRKMAKSLVAARPLPAGHVLQLGDLARKAPSGGLHPYLLESVVGFTLTRALDVDEPLTDAHLHSETYA